MCMKRGTMLTPEESQTRTEKNVNTAIKLNESVAYIQEPENIHDNQRDYNQSDCNVHKQIDALGQPIASLELTGRNVNMYTDRNYIIADFQNNITENKFDSIYYNTEQQFDTIYNVDVEYPNELYKYQTIQTHLHDNTEQANLHSHINQAHLHSHINQANLQSHINQANLHDNTNETYLHSNSTQAHLHSNSTQAHLHGNIDQIPDRYNNLTDNSECYLHQPGNHNAQFSIKPSTYSHEVDYNQVGQYNEQNETHSDCFNPQIQQFNKQNFNSYMHQQQSNNDNLYKKQEIPSKNFKRSYSSFTPDQTQHSQFSYNVMSNNMPSNMYQQNSLLYGKHATQPGTQKQAINFYDLNQNSQIAPDTHAQYLAEANRSYGYNSQHPIKRANSQPMNLPAPMHDQEWFDQQFKKKEKEPFEKEIERSYIKNGNRPPRKVKQQQESYNHGILQNYQIEPEAFEYLCNLCDKKFKRLSTLKIHILSHLKEAPIFWCPAGNCPMTFKTQSLCIKHICTFHPEHKIKYQEAVKKTKVISVFRTHTAMIDYYNMYQPNVENPFLHAFCFGCFTYPRSFEKHPCSGFYFGITSCPSCKTEIRDMTLKQHILANKACLRRKPKMKSIVEKNE